MWSKVVDDKNMRLNHDSGASKRLLLYMPSYLSWRSRCSSSYFLSSLSFFYRFSSKLFISLSYSDWIFPTSISVFCKTSFFIFILFELIVIASHSFKTFFITLFWQYFYDLSSILLLYFLLSAYSFHPPKNVFFVFLLLKYWARFSI